MDLSIIIPAFKEPHKLPSDVEAADRFLTDAHLSGEIIVVDDGSPDDTAISARALQAAHPRLLVLSYKNNRGKGHAIAQGVEVARGRLIMFADAGLCVPYDIARIAVTMLDLDMCDIAHGSRRMRGSVRKAQPFYRMLGSRAYSLLIHTVMGVPTYIVDTQCGFKVYRSSAAKQLYSELLTDGFMFDIEILLRALGRGYRILEFPVLWSNDADTRFNPLTGSGKLLQDLAKIRIALWRGQSAGTAKTLPGYKSREECHLFLPEIREAADA